MNQDFDLFGDPIDPHHGARGRPRHKPTQEFRNRVMVLLAFDWSDIRIAHALGITDKTLRKHYSDELKFRAQAHDKIAAVHMSHLWAAMRTGNVAAMKEFGRLMEKHALDQVEDDFTRSQSDSDQEVATRLGKKELANLEAQTAGDGTEWGGDLETPPTGRLN